MDRRTCGSRCKHKRRAWGESPSCLPPPRAPHLPAAHGAGEWAHMRGMTGRVGKAGFRTGSVWVLSCFMEMMQGLSSLIKSRIGPSCPKNLSDRTLRTGGPPCWAQDARAMGTSCLWPSRLSWGCCSVTAQKPLCPVPTSSPQPLGSARVSLLAVWYRPRRLR